MQPTVKVYIDGTKHWYLNGKLHREDGPAIEYADGSKAWWLNGVEIDQLVFWVTTNERQLQKNFLTIPQQ